nr:hypothetical protein [Streptomyces sp. DSM 41633]
AVLLAARLAIDLPPSAVLALAPVALGSAAIDVTVLVVVSGNHPAPLRPEVLLPHPEPQVRAASMTATALWVSLAGPLAAGLGYIAPDVPALSVAACLLVLALAHRTGAALPRRWSGRAASDTPVTAAQAAELPEDARAQL